MQFGNVTYWTIVPARAESPSAVESLLPQRILPAIAPRDIIVAGSPWILHISDIHASRTRHFYKIDDSDSHNTSLATEIRAAIERHKHRIDTPPGIVVVTGDLTWTGDRSEFDLAIRILEDLRSMLGITRRQFVIIPGNHDILWSQTSAGYDPNSPVSTATAEATRNYRDFFQAWYKTAPHETLAIGSRFFCHGGPSVDILGLNSSELSQIKDGFAGMGRITDAAFEGAAEELGWNERVRPTQVRILATHHHVRPVSWLERPTDSRRGFGIAIDAAAVLMRAQTAGVNLILHGHQHQPYFGLGHDTSFGSKERSRGVLISGAGSCGVHDSDLGAIRQRSFQLLRFLSPDRLESLLFAQPSDGRKFDLTWSSKASHETGWIGDE